MSRPAGYEAEWYVASDATWELVRDAARRLAGTARCPVRVHRHPSAVGCVGRRHELVVEVEQLELDGVAAGVGVSRAVR